MKKPKQEFITIRADKFLKKQLKDISKLMKISQRRVIEIALMELKDLLNTYPQVDYREDLGGWLLRKDETGDTDE